MLTATALFSFLTDLTIYNMKDEELEIEEPTGKFILDNLPVEKRFQTANGMYVHYSDVCQLLKKYYESKVKKLNKADVVGRSESFVCGHPPNVTYLNDGVWHCEKCGGKWNSLANK